MIPPLYFENHTAVMNKSNSMNALPELPPELLARAADFCGWGGLARLACTQTAWKGLLEAAASSPEAEWALAIALIEGKDGLGANPAKGLRLLRKLTGVATTSNEVPGLPILPEHGDENEDDAIGSEHDASDPPITTSTNDHGAPAMRRISECCFEGVGTPKDAAAGLAWLQAAFWLGDDAIAAHDVAMLFEYGHRGVERDPTKAFSWFRRAALAGHADAMAELGLCYELGCGVEADDEKALDWYTQAAQLGHATAKFSVGEAFEEARGVPQSDEEACLWYYRAALVGDEDSKRALRRLYEIARIVVPGVGDLLSG